LDRKRLSRDDVGVSWWRRTRIKTRRVVSFILLSAGKGFPVWQPIWSAGAYVAGLTILAAVGWLFSANALVIFLAFVIFTVLTLACGAFRVWDEADTGRDQSSGGGFQARASLTGFGQRHVGQAPDTIQFDVGPAPLKTLNIASPHGRGRPVAVRFVKPRKRTVRRQDVPKWVRWGPPWRRRQLLIKGLSEASLLIEPLGEVPDGLEVEVYHENG
jgi:hypothetical protein